MMITSYDTVGMGGGSRRGRALVPLCQYHSSWKQTHARTHTCKKLVERVLARLGSEWFCPAVTLRNIVKSV